MTETEGEAPAAAPPRTRRRLSLAMLAAAVVAAGFIFQSARRGTAGELAPTRETET